LLDRTGDLQQIGVLTMSAKEGCGVWAARLDFQTFATRKIQGRSRQALGQPAVLNWFGNFRVEDDHLAAR